MVRRSLQMVDRNRVDAAPHDRVHALQTEPPAHLFGEHVKKSIATDRVCRAGLNGIHFRQDSFTGEMLVMRSRREVKLNVDLH